MKKISLYTLLALTSTNAYAWDYSLFLGGNMDLGFISWNNDTKSLLDSAGIKLADINQGLGGEFGVRISKPENIYNFSLSFDYKYLFNVKADEISNYLIDEVKSGFDTYTGIFTNYLRLNEENKIFFEFGFGAGKIQERYKIDMFDGTRSSSKYKETIFKFHTGISGNFEDSEHLSWNALMHFIVPTSSDSDIDTIYNISLGIRYTF